MAFNAVKFSAESFSPATGKKLQSRFGEVIQVASQIAEEKDGEVRPIRDRLRILVIIRLEGYWREKSTKEQVAQFDGTYRAIFNFNQDVLEESVDGSLRQKMFRDFLVVQAYPLARMHMFNQLSIMGVTSRRKLGFDVYSGDFETLDSSEADILKTTGIPAPYIVA